MKVYHVSLDNSRVNIFTPRVPMEEMRLVEEDSTSSRFCVSTTIEGCLSAVPWGGESLGAHKGKKITVYLYRLHCIKMVWSLMLFIRMNIG